MNAARRIGVEPHELERKRADPADGLARPVAEVARPVVPALVDSVQVAFRALERNTLSHKIFSHIQQQGATIKTQEPVHLLTI